MINLKEHEAEFNGKTYIPFEIAEKAVLEAYESSKEYKQTSKDLKKLRLELNSAMKELGQGFEELANLDL